MASGSYRIRMERKSMKVSLNSDAMRINKTQLSLYADNFISLRTFLGNWLSVIGEVVSYADTQINKKAIDRKSLISTTHTR